MNYTELTSAVQGYLQNSETSFVAEIPTFVRQAEERIFRTVQIPELRKNATTSTVASTRFLARPADFLAPFSLAVVDGDGDYTFLYKKDVNFIREAYPSVSTEGEPRYYAIFDGDEASPASSGHFIFGPTPDAAYTVQLHYYYDPPSIVTSSTSWLGDNAETALLYGTLIEGYRYNKGEADMLAEYKEAFRDGMEALRSLEAQLQQDAYGA